MRGVGSYGDELISPAKRTINPIGEMLIAAGVMFPITHRVIKDSEKVDFGPSHTVGGSGSGRGSCSLPVLVT